MSKEWRRMFFHIAATAARATLMLALCCMLLAPGRGARAAEDPVAGDVVELREKGIISVTGQGSGIQSVHLEITNKSSRPAEVRIPVGAYFVCSNGGAQNMVATEAKSLSLAPGQSSSLEVAAACANIALAIPTDQEQFQITLSPRARDLALLMPVLEKAGCKYATRQAAVWIVTDNSTYGGLGTLVTRRLGQFTSSRTILEPEAAEAMWVVDCAGIDVSKRRIWNDRREIMQGAEGKFKTWLQERSGPEEIKQIQQLLASRKLYQGPVDGAHGPRTSQAIIAFERSHNLPQTGSPTSGLLTQLRTLPLLPPPADAASPADQPTTQTQPTALLPPVTQAPPAPSSAVTTRSQPISLSAQIPQTSQTAPATPGGQIAAKPLESRFGRLRGVRSEPTPLRSVPIPKGIALPPQYGSRGRE